MWRPYSKNFTLPGLERQKRLVCTIPVQSCFLAFRELLTAPVVLGDPPRQRFVFIAADGSRVALLSHSELRDEAATEVTIKGAMDVAFATSHIAISAMVYPTLGSGNWECLTGF